MKVSSESATTINPSIMQGVKEIEPWGMFEQTAWEYVTTMVEEEVYLFVVYYYLGTSKIITEKWSK